MVYKTLASVCVLCQVHISHYSLNAQHPAAHHTESKVWGNLLTLAVLCLSLNSIGLGLGQAQNRALECFQMRQHLQYPWPSYLTDSLTDRNQINQTYQITQITQINPNQTKSTQIIPNQPKSTQIHPDPPRSTQVNLDQPISIQINPDQPRSTQINPNQPRSIQINPD